MRYLLTAILVCGCQAKVPYTEVFSPQPVFITVISPEPGSQPDEPEPEFEPAKPKAPSLQTMESRWECSSKKDCSNGLVCCGRAEDSSCQEFCDQGIWSTLCESDDECIRPNFPSLGPDDPLCVPAGGPYDVKACLFG